MSSFSRRDFIRSAVAVATVGALGPRLGASPAYGGTTVPFLPYSADSFFKSTVVGAPIDAARTAAFRTFMSSFPGQMGTPYPYINGIGASKWGTAYAEGASTDPVWKLTGVMSSLCDTLRTQGFHAPEWFGQQLSGTTDSPFTVIDRASGFTVFGGKAYLAGSYLINVGSAGITYHSSNGLDRRNPATNDKRNFTGRGRLSDAMAIRRDLVDQGIATNTGLGHALHLFLVATNASDGFCHPMVGTETRHTDGWGAEGERLAISPDVDLTKRGLSPAALVVARTLQQHGCYIGDNAGTASALKAEQTSVTRNPWAGLDFDKKCLAGVSWNDFVVLPKGWQS